MSSGSGEHSGSGEQQPVTTTVRCKPSTCLLASNLFSVKDFVAVVTGGGTGVGLMITQALCANGAKVYITGRRQKVLDTVVREYSGKCGHQSGSGEIIGISCDVTQRTELHHLGEEISRREPNGVHILVNNAGVALEDGTTKIVGDPPKIGGEYLVDFTSAKSLSYWFLRGDPEVWARTYDTNVTALFFTTGTFLPHLSLAQQKTPEYSPTVINISSVGGSLKEAYRGQFAYATSKAAVMHLTQLMATALTKAKIRVNCIAPGLFPSEMTTGGSDERNKSYLNEPVNCPAGRPGKEEDIAGAVLYLAGLGGVYINGQTVYPDGGMVLTRPATV